MLPMDTNSIKQIKKLLDRGFFFVVPIGKLNASLFPTDFLSNSKMQHETVRFYFLLLLLLHRLTSVSLEEVESMPLEVIVDSSPCSATCGLGIKTQTLCLLKDGETATEEVTSKDGTEVLQRCLEHLTPRRGCTNDSCSKPCCY